jgi:hypothetical protein
MTPTQLAEQINFQCEKSEPQDERNLAELEYHYNQMFQTYCGKQVLFEIINDKGQIQLKGYG